MLKSPPGTGATRRASWARLRRGLWLRRYRRSASRSAGVRQLHVCDWDPVAGDTGCRRGTGLRSPDGHQVRAGVDTVSNSAGGRDAG